MKEICVAVPIEDIKTMKSMAEALLAARTAVRPQTLHIVGSALVFAANNWLNGPLLAPGLYEKE